MSVLCFFFFSYVCFRFPDISLIIDLDYSILDHLRGLFHPSSFVLVIDGTLSPTLLYFGPIEDNVMFKCGGNCESVSCLLLLDV